MNVRNEPVQETFCVVKRETPPVWRWKLCEFQHRKSSSVSGINLRVWRGSELFWNLTVLGYLDFLCRFFGGDFENVSKVVVGIAEANHNLI